MDNKYLDALMQNLSGNTDTEPSSVYESEYAQIGGSKPDVTVPLGGVLPIYYCTDDDKKKLFEREHRKKREFTGNTGVGISIASILQKRKKGSPLVSLSRPQNEGKVEVSSASSSSEQESSAKEVKETKKKNTYTVKINYPWNE